MPGVLPHLLTGVMLYFTGRIIFKDYFEKKPGERVILGVVCLSFSFLPDIFLGAFYTTHILSFEILAIYHNLMHYVFIPIAFILLVLLIFWKGVSRKPIWIIGLFALGIHIVMDLLFQEFGVLI
jgi:hypothetical protein